MASKHIAVIFAGGTGKRMLNSSRPKQFLEFRGKPVLAYALEHFQRHQEIDGIVLVALEGWLDHCGGPSGRRSVSGWGISWRHTERL